jgi:autophagy-related protein 16
MATTRTTTAGVSGYHTKEQPTFSLSQALINRNHTETYPYAPIVASSAAFRAQVAAAKSDERTRRLASVTGTDTTVHTTVQSMDFTTRHTMGSLPPAPQVSIDGGGSSLSGRMHSDDERSSSLESNRIYTELAEVRRANASLTETIAKRDATISNLSSEYSSSEASLTEYGKIIAYHKTTIEALTEELDEAKEKLGHAVANEQTLIERLVSEKTSMMDQIVEMTNLVESLQAELKMVKAILATFEAGGKTVLDGESTEGFGKSANDFMTTRVPNGVLSISKPHTADIMCLRISKGSTSTLITCSSDSTCKSLDLTSSIPRQASTYTSPTAQPLTTCTTSPTGLIATGSVDKTIRIYTPGSSKQNVLQGHSGKISDLSFTDSSTLISAAHDRTLRIWSVSKSSSTMTNTLRCSSIPNSVASSNSTSSVVTGHADGGVRFWDVKTSQKVLELPSVHVGQCTSVAYHPIDGYTVCTTGRDNIVRLVDSRVGEVVVTLSDVKYRVNYNWSNAAFSPDGSYIVTGSAKDVLIWSLTAGKVEKVLQGHNELVETVAWGSGERQVVSGDKGGGVVVWE